jgi:hypothetical protein
MYKSLSIEKNNCFYSTIFLILFIFFFKKFTYCLINQQKINYSSYKYLDINNEKNKENILKIDLDVNPSKKSNSFLQITDYKELYNSDFVNSRGIKQFLHFHPSV